MSRSFHFGSKKTQPPLPAGFVVLFFTLLFSLNASSQTVYYVNDASTSGDVFTTAAGNDAPGNGLSPASPKLTLRGLATEYGGVLSYGDTIKIDAGTYHNEENFNVAIAGLTFMGAGSELTFFDDDLAGASTNYFMRIHANDITLKDMTIMEYENNGTQAPGHSGQAITIYSATGILLENIVMMQNGSSGGNPSISVLSNSGVTVRGGGGFCNVWQTAWTGGIEAFGTNINLDIYDYILSYNYKENGYDGGGLRIEGDATTVVTVQNCRISNNIATDGGGIYMMNGNLTLTDCIIDGNTAGIADGCN
jgi:hypothetical protein